MNIVTKSLGNASRVALIPYGSRAMMNRPLSSLPPPRLGNQVQVRHSVHTTADQ